MKAKKLKKPTYTVSVVISVDHYIYSEFFRLTFDEIKEKFDSWARNGHQILHISVTFDGEEYLRVKDFEDLCWVIKYTDDSLLEYAKDYLLTD